jgi:hypothetical protein
VAKALEQYRSPFHFSSRARALLPEISGSSSLKMRIPPMINPSARRWHPKDHIVDDPERCNKKTTWESLPNSAQGKSESITVLLDYSKPFDLARF